MVRKWMLTVVAVAGLMGFHFQAYSAESLDPQMFFALNRFYSDPIMGRAKPLSSDPIMGVVKGETASDPIMGRVSAVSSDPIMGSVKEETASDPIMEPSEEVASDLQVNEMDNAVNTLLADSNMYQVLKTVLNSDPIMMKHLNLVLSDPQMIDTLKENLLSDPQM